MPIIRNGRIEENAWVSLAETDAGALSRETPIVVGLAEWVAGRETLIANFDRRAVRLENADAVEEIADDLDFIDAVILVFPKFNDGRAFSQARLLRDRLGFKGEIRATGHVIQDQFLFLQRCGVDAVEVKDGKLLDAWNRAHKRFKGFYQPALAIPEAESEDKVARNDGFGGAYSRVEPAVLASWAY
ncbi:MAG: DUF934 domain-containing protein [Nisaea sp.]|uniref:DUF934 domain-containing protein n=1 Tax=Nisaea sp. TaxID=2024842 RepID=UPI001B088C5C|nr:DUF934 domain-containing protein [Nisaea sp.]MBO6562656.1 DUF934 domain-containing protein [Nisaea sp.]